MRILGIVAAMSLPLFLVPDQPAEACGAKVSVKGAKIARMRKVQHSSGRAPIAAGPIVAVRSPAKTGGDTGGGDRGPAASGGGETKAARTPKPRPRPKSEPVAPQPREEAATPTPTPDLPRETKEPAPKEETEPKPIPEPGPEKTPKGKFATHYYFGNASSNLTPQSKAKLKATAHWLKVNPDKSIVVEGHASTNGNHAANQSLSEVRANAVKDQLVSLGVDESRISVEAYGSDRPEVQPGASPKNRRVIITLK